MYEICAGAQALPPAQGPPRAVDLLLAGYTTLTTAGHGAAASANLADGFAAMGVRGAIVPLFVRDVLHRSVLWTGIGFLAFAALNAVALLPGGKAADAPGRRPVIIASTALFVLSSIGAALSPNILFLLTCRVIQGCSAGGGVVVAVVVIQRAEPGGGVGAAAGVLLQRTVSKCGVGTTTINVVQAVG